MADDLSAAPSTGASEPVSAPAETVSAPASESPKTEAKALSGREAAAKAISEVMAKAPGERDRAAAVLKEGAGADDKLDASHSEALDNATAAEKAANDAVERAKKGWETRRANQEQAKADQKQAETITEAVKAAIPPAEKPAAEQPSPPAVETKHPEAPKWMTKQAASEWQKLPEVVREEVVKRSEAFDRGFAEVKAKADRLDELREFDELSQQHYKQPLKETLKYYADLDRTLANPDTNLSALEKIVGNMKYKATDGNLYNWDLKQLAQHILDQDVDTFQDPSADIQRKLDEALARIDKFEKGQSERETQRTQQERERATTTLQEKINEFATKNPRFNELWEDVEIELHNPKFEAGKDPIDRLQKAYEKVAKLKPSPSLSPPAPDLPAHDTAAQTRRGTASVSGAPSGSTPAGKRPTASSPREAARMALSKYGIGSGA